MIENNHIPELNEYSAAGLHPDLISGLNFEDEHSNNNEENLPHDEDMEVDHQFNYSALKSH